MITEENLRQIYQEVIKGNDLTTKKLNNFGLNSRDLKEFIEKGNLIRVKRGLYALQSANELFFYGKELIHQKKKKEAMICFQKCIEIDPNHHGANFQLFFDCIETKQFEKSWQYLDILHDPKYLYYYHDSNFYLYLLLMMDKIPEKYRDTASHFKLEDVEAMVGDKRYRTPFQNKIRKLALNQNFKMANFLLKQKGKQKIQNQIIQILLDEDIKVQDKNRNYVIQLILEKNYQEIIEFYQERQQKYPLSMAEQYTVLLAKDILKIQNQEKLTPTNQYTENLFEAIRENNFKLALKLIESKKTNPIYLLLKEIVNLLPSVKEEKDEDQEFIKNKHEELLTQKGIILLKPMDPIKAQKILQITIDYPDIMPFVIHHEKKEQIVLRYKNLQERFDVSHLSQASQRAYEEQRYEDCIAISFRILETVDKPKALIYARIGLAYMKKKQTKLAIDYLTIATELSKNEKENFDFSELIKILKRKKKENTSKDSSEEKKVKFKMTQNEFNPTKEQNFYGIHNFEAINQFISNSSFNVDEACEQLNLTPEQIDLIKLIYAREFFKQGKEKTGNLFFKSVEKNKEKTKEIKRVLEEIRKNKKLYQNKQYESVLELKPTLSPKK